VDYVVLDLETTGLNPQTDQIIEIGAVKIGHGVLCEEFSTLINPRSAIPQEITELTGISPEMVEHKPVITEVIGDLEEFLHNGVLVGHNIFFDRGFLQPYLRGNYVWLDTVELAKILLPYETGYSLGDLARSLGMDHIYAHRALGDARTTAFLFLHLLEELKKVDFPVLTTLYRLAQNHQSGVSALITQEFSARARFFPQDKIGSRQLVLMGDTNKGLFSSSFIKEKNENYRISQPEIDRLFQPGGHLSAILDAFQYRRQQEEMAQAVSDSFNKDQHLVVEAGTGTGKSLAYLLPALLWSVKSGKKVVVSTHTINLQEQLINKDIPLAGEILGLDFHAAVIKGRSHYLCLRKWEHWLEEAGGEGQGFMMRLVLWLSQTETGDGSELSLARKELLDWQRFAAGRDTCFGAKCKFYRGNCFVSRAKKLAELSHVVIVNHSLLLANAAANDNILPDFKYLIIDEAHHLEKVAEDQFGAEIGFFDLIAIFNRVKKSGANYPAGVLDHLAHKAAPWDFLDEDIKQGLVNSMHEAAPVVGECIKYAGEFFAVLDAFLSHDSSSGGLHSRTVRILPSHRCTEKWEGILAAGDNLMVKMKELMKILLASGEKISLAESGFGLEIVESHEINLLLSTLHQLIRDLKVVIEGDEDYFVSWVEYSGENSYPLLHTAPVEVREQLHQYLFSAKSSVVLTSATLAVGGDFGFFSESIGMDLSPAPVRVMQLESPFAFEENVLLSIASDLPDPSVAPEFLFSDGVAHALIKLIAASKGRTLVLFTSHHQLKQVFEKIKGPLRQEGITVYAHGLTGSRTKVLESFKTRENSVILGANSFWEGIDVVGEALTSVIIVKLPFWPPTLPTVSARLDRYRALHINGFRRYSLPQAIIRFKQGFGRLIRSHSDFGVISVLDRRLYEKKYGETFLKSLPKVKITVDNTDELAKIIKEWMHTKGLRQ